MYDALTPAEYGDILIRRDMDYGLAAQTLSCQLDVYDLSHFAILGYIKEMPEMAFVASPPWSRDDDDHSVRLGRAGCREKPTA